MSGWATWLIGGALLVFFLDRSLRWMEERGWIYYRTTRPGRSTVVYHTLEASSVFHPSFRVVQEIQARQEGREDEAGDPHGAYPPTGGGGDSTP